MKFHIVLRNYHKESLLREFNFSKFKNLLVIVIHFTGERKRSHINHINFGVFAGKYSTYLWVLSVFKLFHRCSFHFIYTYTIDMNLNPPLSLNLIPFWLKLIHHVLPFAKRLLVKFRYFQPCVLLKLVKSVFSLNHSCLCHKESKLIIWCESLVSSPVLLNSDRC